MIQAQLSYPIPMKKLKFMKYKKNLAIAFIFLCSAMIHQKLPAVLTVSQYKPDSFLQKPSFSQDYFTNISCIFSGGSATQAYNNNGEKVPCLQQFGTENLLKKFTDSSISTTSVESFGQGELTGEFHVQELIVSCYKNMTHGLFIEGATTVQNLLLNSISIDFISTPIKLTDEQIDYLQSLQGKIPLSMSKSGMFTTACYAGYNKTFSNFTHLDFIDFIIKAGFTSPQVMSNNNTSLLQFPFVGNMNFGYPIVVAASLGVLDWLTIGCNGSITPWQSTTKTISMNNSRSRNNLLIPQSGIANIQRGPLITTGVYLEADHLYQGLSSTIAYCYTKNYAQKITPIDQLQFPINITNESNLLDTWSLGSFYIQFDVDFACETRASAPILTIFCNIPVAGHLCPKTNIFGGSCSLQLSYIF